MGHPVSVAFHDSMWPGQVSPLVYCPYGGETVLRDLREIVAERGWVGTTDLTVRLLLRWVEIYGARNVAVYNLDACGIAEGASPEDIYRMSLAYLRARVAADSTWIAVDLDGMVIDSQHGTWSLGE